MGTGTTDKGNHILLIGTNEGQIRQMEFDLQEAGYQLVVANSAQAGLALATEHAPALVIVDRLLGGESGLVLCQTLRN
ncbi:MAG: DNA-binding response regulator, partial [Nodosilinea sp.]